MWKLESHLFRMGLAKTCIHILVVAGATLNIDNVSQKVHDIENSLLCFFLFFFVFCFVFYPFFCIYLTFFVLIPS